MKKRMLALALVFAMSASLAACGGTTSTPTASQTTEKTEAPASEASEASEAPELYQRTGDHDADSEAIYYAQLGEFWEAYEAAKEEQNLSLRYAKMAVAEGLLLEAATFMPTTSQGGVYAIRRFAPYSSPSVDWGSESDDFSDRIVTNELISADDFNALKALWSEVRGTGTYQEKAKEYLAAHGYTLKDSYNIGYTSDPTTWDQFTSFLATTSEATINTTDHLYAYNCENEQVPALAESYTVSEDGLTYTFKLREGLKWVDSQGREIADLTADDFVAGMQHFLDCDGQSGAGYLAGSTGACVKNVDDYLAGAVTFDQVGVKAVDDLTVEYTLSDPCSFFMTVIAYTTFEPLCRSYFESQGGAFGADYDPTTCQYGIDPDHIAYCGPYVVTSATANNSIVFKANPTYWNADGINVKTLTWYFNDGTDITKAYNDTLSGILDGCGLNASTLAIAKEDGNFEKYAVTSGCDATAFVAYYNMNRGQFVNYNDDTKAVSTQTDAQKELAYAAMNNVHFRRALSTAVDRVNYNAQTSSQDVAEMSLTNSYTKGTFVSLSEDTTVAINGVDTTFPAGTWYGEIIQAQLDADGIQIKVFDKEADGGIGSGSGFDGWYNPDYAKSEMAIAVEELKAQGYEVSAENPIVLDYPTWTGNEGYANKGNAYKQSVETVLDGLVDISLVECVDATTWYYTQYYVSSSTEMNFDIGDLSGWSPDFGDPSTFLETMAPDYVGYCTQNLGLY